MPFHCLLPLCLRRQLSIYIRFKVICPFPLAVFKGFLHFSHFPVTYPGVFYVHLACSFPESPESVGRDFSSVLKTSWPFFLWIQLQQTACLLYSFLLILITHVRLPSVAHLRGSGLCPSRVPSTWPLPNPMRHPPPWPLPTQGLLFPSRPRIVHPLPAERPERARDSASGSSIMSCSGHPLTWAVAWGLPGHSSLSGFRVRLAPDGAKGKKASGGELPWARKSCQAQGERGRGPRGPGPTTRDRVLLGDQGWWEERPQGPPRWGQKAPRGRSLGGQPPLTHPHRRLRWALSLTEATAGRVGGGKKGRNEPQGRGGTVHWELSASPLNPSTP